MVMGCDVADATPHVVTTHFADIAMKTFYHSNLSLLEHIFKLKLIIELLELNTLKKKIMMANMYV